MGQVAPSIQAIGIALALSSVLGMFNVRTAAAQSAVPAQPDDRTIAHVLNRIGFGPAPGDIERVRRVGLETYIEQQLHPERLADADMSRRLTRLQTLTKSTRDLADTYFVPAQMARRERQRSQGAAARSMSAPAEQTPTAMAGPGQAAIRAERQVLLELSQQKILRAAYSERQLEEVMVDFWFNHFNVFAGKGPTRMYLTEYERDAIRPHALGRFRDLLQATAESPAMLFYLDNWQSAAPRRTVVGARRGLNENYARELLELHTLGVDGGYTQADVQQVARAFTGWTIARPRRGGPFRFEPRLHDDREKHVLGHTIAPGGGKKDGERVLDILASHRSTARHIATKLSRRFVSDDPPAGLVDRAAKRYLETGGDIREVLRAILKSPEFFAPAAYRAKIKSPFEFVVSTIRAAGADAANAAPLVQSVRDLGMPLYMCQPPTGYGDTARTWVNTGALLARMNFAVALADGRIRGTRMPAPAPQGNAQAKSVITEVLAGDIAATTAATVAKAARGPQALALVLGSPDFQKR